MNIKGNTPFQLLFILIFAVGFSFSMKWGFKARLFPQLIVISGLVISIYEFLKNNFFQHTLKSTQDKKAIPEQEEIQSFKKAAITKSELRMILWVFIFFCMVILLGFWITIVLYTILFMSVFGRENWKTVIIYTAGIWIMIYFGFSVVISSSLYGGIFGLTW